MRVYKVFRNLWRVSNNGKVKDVKVEFGEIVPPENPYNILTPTEQQSIEMELF